MSIENLRFPLLHRSRFGLRDSLCFSHSPTHYHQSMGDAEVCTARFSGASRWVSGVRSVGRRVQKRPALSPVMVDFYRGNNSLPKKKTAGKLAHDFVDEPGVSVRQRGRHPSYIRRRDDNARLGRAFFLQRELSLGCAQDGGKATILNLEVG